MGDSGNVAIPISSVDTAHVGSLSASTGSFASAASPLRGKRSVGGAMRGAASVGRFDFAAQSRSTVSSSTSSVTNGGGGGGGGADTGVAVVPVMEGAGKGMEEKSTSDRDGREV